MEVLRWSSCKEGACLGDDLSHATYMVLHNAIDHHNRIHSKYMTIQSGGSKIFYEPDLLP